jgi:transcriptional regulator with XRE-family HTH domain
MVMADGAGLAQQLQAALAAAGINQAELARRAGVTRAYVGRLLAGDQAAPTDEVLAALATALDLSPVARLQLFLVAGRVPAEIGPVAAQEAVAGLLVTLHSLSPARRRAAERLLVDLCAVIEPTER